MDRHDPLELTAAELEAAKAGHAVVAGVEWVPRSDRQRMIEQADDQRRRPIAAVYCAACTEDHRIVATIFDTPVGPLYAADVPSREATLLAREWSGDRGRVPPGYTPVRVLLEGTELEGTELTASCPRHSAVRADLEEVRRAVTAYRRTGRRGKVRAEPPTAP